MENRIVGKTVRAINEEFITFDDGSVFLLVGHSRINRTVEPQEVGGFTVYPHPPSGDCDECSECCLGDMDCSSVCCGYFIMKKEKYNGE